MTYEIPDQTPGHEPDTPDEAVEYQEGPPDAFEGHPVHIEVMREDGQLDVVEGTISPVMIDETEIALAHGGRPGKAQRMIPGFKLVTFGLEKPGVVTEQLVLAVNRGFVYLYDSNPVHPEPHEPLKLREDVSMRHAPGGPWEMTFFRPGEPREPVDSSPEPEE